MSDAVDPMTYPHGYGEIAPDSITLDANHPLARQRVTFVIRVIGVRAASRGEIEKRQAENEAEEEVEECEKKA